MADIKDLLIQLMHLVARDNGKPPQTPRPQSAYQRLRIDRMKQIKSAFLSKIGF